MSEFVGAAEHAEVAALIVTYNSAEDIGGLLESLRAEAADLRIRVVVIDNASDDDTLAVLRAHPDVIGMSADGNLGYAGGMNIARRFSGDTDALLILNPDLRIAPGAVRALRDELDAHPGAGIVAPRIIDASGRTAMSLHNEPGLLRALADAVLGPLWRQRPAMLSEWVRDDRAYTHARPIDWATGAALLISAAADRVLGEWDERFFLYSEETDYCRRAREAGFGVRYTPAAVVQHRQGGSGASAQLDALLQINRVRYIRKHRPRRAPLYRQVVRLHALLRARRSEAHRLTLHLLADERRWATLPHAHRASAAPASGGSAQRQGQRW